MKIKSVSSKYIQKSRLFLYPTLNIKRGESTTPIQTYMCWENKYELEDCKFITQYHVRNDKDFRIFEDVKLLGNPFFEDTFPLEDDTAAYVFNLSHIEEDFMNIIEGKYSRLSVEHKHTVMKFFKSHNSHHIYLDSYLYPEKYFTDYAEALNVSTGLLREVGELCSKPNLEEETLKINVNIMKYNSLSLDL